MIDAFKRVMRLIIGDYGLYQVWTLDRASAATQADLAIRPLLSQDLSQAGLHTTLTEAAWYFGEQAHGYGCFEGDQLRGLAFFWHGDRYASRHSWPLPAGAAKLVHIVTDPAQRGRGFATALIRAASQAMISQGFHPLYARIWHSNKPSQQAFSRAGWRPAGWLVQVNPLRRPRPWRICLPRP